MWLQLSLEEWLGLIGAVLTFILIPLGRLVWKRRIIPWRQARREQVQRIGELYNALSSVKTSIEQRKAVDAELKQSVTKLVQSQQSQQSRLIKLEKKVESIQIKIEPFWKLVESSLAKLLIQPLHKELDALLLQFSVNAEGMSREDLVHLKELLALEGLDASQQIVRVLVLSRVIQLLHLKEESLNVEGDNNV